MIIMGFDQINAALVRIKVFIYKCVDFFSGVWCYEHNQGTEGHHHEICRTKWI